MAMDIMSLSDAEPTDPQAPWSPRLEAFWLSLPKSVSIRVGNCLAFARITTLAMVIELAAESPPRRLLRIKNMGKESVRLIKQRLRSVRRRSEATR